MGRGSRIHWLHLCRGVRHPSTSVLDMTLMGEAPVMLELWRMWSTPSLPLLPGSLWPRVVAPDRILSIWRCPWCNGYRRRKWTRWHEFKSWTRLIAFHIALIPLGKVWIQLFSLQLWVNSRTDLVLQPRWGN